jgi:hypothetical protein
VKDWPKFATDVNNLEFHEAANLFPLLEGPEWEAFVEDVRANGLREPIKILGGKILDGRNRYRACQQLLIKPRFEELIAGYTDPVRYVISLNLHRRHLTAEQRRAVIAAVLKESPDKSNRQVAGQVKVDHKTVADVRQQLEGRGEIPHVEKAKDSKGRKQPVRKTKGVRQRKSLSYERAKQALEEMKRHREEKSKTELQTDLADQPETESPVGLTNGEIKVQGVGACRGHEALNSLMEISRCSALDDNLRKRIFQHVLKAINSLARIPKNDALRKRGFQIVTDWLGRNS